MADDSVHQELEGLRFSDDEEEDDVKVILNNKATDGNNDSFSETPSPGECNLSHVNYQDGVPKVLPQTNNRFLNESFEKQSLCVPIVETDVCATLHGNDGSGPELMVALAQKNEFGSEEMPELENQFEKLTVDQPNPETSLETQVPMESESVTGSNVDECIVTGQIVNDADLECESSGSKPGKQLRPDAPVFMPSFLNAAPQPEYPAAGETILTPHLEPSAGTSAEVLNAEVIPLESENGYVLEPEQECPATNTLSSTPKSKHFVQSSVVDAADNCILEEQTSHLEPVVKNRNEPILSKESLQSSVVETLPEKSSVDSKSTSACGASGLDLKIKQLVASNYMYQCQMEALKQDQNRLLLLLSNSKVSKSKKQTFDLLVEQMNKLQFEIRSLKMEKEQLERKLRTSVKKSSSPDAKNQLSEVLTNGQRRNFSCQTVPNFDAEKKLLAFKSAQNELQVSELKSFLGKLYMQNALSSVELLSIAESVTNLESKLRGNIQEQEKHIARLSELQSVSELPKFNPPFPNLWSEISNLRCQIFDKMLNSLNGAKRVQVSPSVSVTSNGFDGLHSCSKALAKPVEAVGSTTSSAKEQSQSGSESGPETESEEEQTRVAFRVPVKKPQLTKTSAAKAAPDPSKVDCSTGTGTKRDNSPRRIEIAQSKMSSKNIPSRVSAESPDLGSINSKPEVSSNSEPPISGTQKSACAANATRRKVDNILEELQKLYPGKSKSELTELIKLSGQYLSKKGYNMAQITVQDVVEGARHVGKQLGYVPVS